MSTEITSNTGRRICEYRKNMGMSQQQLADLIGISRSYLGDIEAERNEPSFNFITSLMAKTDVSSDWLLTGKGEMSREKVGMSAETLSPRKKALLDNYDNSDEKGKRAIEAVAGVEAQPEPQRKQA